MLVLEVEFEFSEVYSMIILIGCGQEKNTTASDLGNSLENAISINDKGLYISR